MANKEVVFVALEWEYHGGMWVLEWIFDHFEIDEVTLILTCFYTDDKGKTKFIDDVQNEYLPRCTTEKFEAEMLIPQGECLSELITEHGMTKLITSTAWISGVLKVFALDPSLSCKIWGIHRYKKVLVYIGHFPRDTRETKEANLNEQITEHNPLKEDKVFIALEDFVSHGERVLDWLFQNFDNEKSKFIITSNYTAGCRTEFINIAQNIYLPRCQTKELEVEILMPREEQPRQIILELITKHGMEKLVMSTRLLEGVLESLGTVPNIPCMIWVIHQDTGKLVYFRDAREIRLIRKENDLHQQKIERRRLTKEYEELILKKPQSKDKLEENACKLQAVNERILDLQGVKNALDLLQSQNNMPQEEENKISEELNQPEEEHHNLQEKQSDAIEGKKQLQIEIQEMKKKEIANLNQLQEANEQKQIIERNFADSEAARQNLQIALRRVEEERDMLQEERNDATREKNQWISEIHDLKERLESLQVAKNKLQIERDNIVKEAERLHKERNRSDFTLQELEHATQNFNDSLILGKGGFGCVYKGYLRGTIVAVKILNSQCMESMIAFKREVDILTSVRHPNLVTLMGACYEASALVYEFLPNGSLEEHLNHENNTSLTWQVRTSIMAEICLALIFLHSSKPNLVIHGDLKPDNVLLDANFVSKLGDFGISRLIEQTGATAFIQTYNIIGTPGYMDPEFVYTGQLTEKSDVFAFGIIILRLITGKPVRGVVSKVREAMENKTLHEIIDESAGKWPVDQVEELTLLGLRCVQMRGSDRPNLFNDVWPIVERLRRH